MGNGGRGKREEGEKKETTKKEKEEQRLKEIIRIEREGNKEEKCNNESENRKWRFKRTS